MTGARETEPGQIEARRHRPGRAQWPAVFVTLADRGILGAGRAARSSMFPPCPFAEKLTLSAPGMPCPQI